MNEFIQKINNRLNPILVKEIIQGLRTKLFVTALILSQVLLFFITVGLLLASNESSSSRQQSETIVLFWMGIAVPFILIMPLRGLNAIHSEVQSKTMEMLFLCNLSTKQIVFGKFFSHCIQILLLAVTILPYIILRYFMGGVNLLLELSIFSIVIVLSLSQTAMTVAVSSFANRNKITHMLRVILFIGLSFALYTSSIGLFAALTHGRSRMPLNFADAIFFLLQTLIFIYYILLMGSTFIASRSENLLPQKRLAVFAILLVYGIGHFFTTNSWIVALPITLLALNALEALFATDNLTASSFRKAKKFKIFDLLFSQIHFSSMLWFNFAFPLAYSLFFMEFYWHDKSRFPSWYFLALPLLWIVFTLAISILGKIRHLSVTASFLSWFVSPITSLLVFITLPLNNDLDTAAGVYFCILGMILIPYCIVTMICKIIKKPVKLPYIFIAYAVCSIFSVFLTALRESDIILHHLPALTPFEFAYVNDLKDAIIIILEVLITLFIMLIFTAKESKVFHQLNDKFKEKKKLSESSNESSILETE